MQFCADIIQNDISLNLASDALKQIKTVSLQQVLAKTVNEIEVWLVKKTWETKILEKTVNHFNWIPQVWSQ